MIQNLTDVKLKKRGLDILSESRIKEILKIFSDEKNILSLTIFISLLETGLRISELLQINVADVNNGFYDLIGKREIKRRIYFNLKTRNILQKYLLERKIRKNKNSLKVFDISRHYVNHLFKKVNIYPHLLRHTFLTFKLRETKNLKLVQQLAGHTNINTTALYLHFTNEEIKEAYLTNNSLKEKFLNLFRKIKNFKEKNFSKIPERKIIYDTAHSKLLIFGEKGVGKSHLIKNTFENILSINWETKSQVKKFLLNNSFAEKVHINFSTFSNTKLLFLESLETKFLVAEFRTNNLKEENILTNKLFEFQPVKIFPFTISEARNYLKNICLISSANYKNVKDLISINTNPLFLKENIFRKRNEILMSAQPITLGFLFILLAITLLISRYIMLGRETYILITLFYFLFRIFARL